MTEHNEYTHLTAAELCERVNAARKRMGYADTRVSYQGRGWYHRYTSGLSWPFKERRSQVEESLRRFEERARQAEAERPLREKTEKDQHRRRSLVLAAEDMLEALRATLRHVDDDMNNRKVTLWILREVVLKAIAKAEGKHDHEWHLDRFNIEVCAHCGEERGELR